MEWEQEDTREVFKIMAGGQAGDYHIYIVCTLVINKMEGKSINCKCHSTNSGRR